MSELHRQQQILESQVALELDSDSPPEAVQEPEAPARVPSKKKPAKRRSKKKGSRGKQPGFKTLIGLTILTALLLLPFVFSQHYLDWLRQESFDLHQFLRGELYKQGTGYAALAFVLFEVMLTARKRSRNWIGKVKIPGSILFWRNFHIFVGVALVGLVLIHTLGANGLNFNAIFLWVFFVTTLTALVGLVAETGIVESTRKVFGPFPWSKGPLGKGAMVRDLRAIWLVSHIFFVSVFVVMLVLHIILAYYFQ
ncbi:MAG: hypothetical protein AAGD25_39645 [Cyanobacteria bacterium P01_F01_bin.150]